MAKESKKEVVELTVEQKLKTLYQLQKTLTEIDKIRTLRGELPLEVQDLEDEIAGLHTRIDKIKAEIEDIRKAIVGKKNEIEKGQASIEKYKVQLDNVRNNREYDFLNKEIEFQTLEVELCNKKIREFTEEQTAKEEEVANSQAALEEREKDVVEKKDELEEIVAETRQQEEKLRDNVKDLEMKIEPRLLQSFKRIRKNSRNGLGIVYVQRDSCGGCFNKIPPQRQLDIRSRKKVIVCEYCGRILIDPELAEVQEVKEEVPVKKTRKRAASTKKKEA
jgi:Zn-ribbon protein, possibly nucleic acid-binding